MKIFIFIVILIYSLIVNAQFSEDLVLQLHSGTQVEMISMNSAGDKTKLFYNTTDNKVYYHNGTSWTVIDGKDATNDSWNNNIINTSVALETKSDGTSLRDAGTEFVILDNGNTGLGTTAPERTLHIQGNVKIVDGTQKLQKVLTSDANGNASWKYANGGGTRGTKTFITSHFTSSNSTTDIFHLKTPFNFSTSDMYYIKVDGYAYGSTTANRIIDLTFVGYCYQPSGTIINPQTSIEGASGDITAGQYIGSDGYIYLWFKTASVYFNSFSVTSMYVGNGRVLNEGEITVIQDSAITL